MREDPRRWFVLEFSNTCWRERSQPLSSQFLISDLEQWVWRSPDCNMLPRRLFSTFFCAFFITLTFWETLVQLSIFWTMCVFFLVSFFISFKSCESWIFCSRLHTESGKISSLLAPTGALIVMIVYYIYIWCSSNFFRFSLSPLMQFMLQVSL